MPNFNLTCNIWDAGVNPTINPPRISVVCNLQHGRKIRTDVDLVGASDLSMFLLLPALTPIKTQINNALWPDEVEVPAGSGRYYYIHNFDDVSKGFMTEYRCAYIIQDGRWGLWPFPTP